MRRSGAGSIGVPVRAYSYDAGAGGPEFTRSRIGSEAMVRAGKNSAQILTRARFC